MARRPTTAMNAAHQKRKWIRRFYRLFTIALAGAVIIFFLYHSRYAPTDPGLAYLAAIAALLAFATVEFGLFQSSLVILQMEQAEELRQDHAALLSAVDALRDDLRRRPVAPSTVVFSLLGLTKGSA